MKYKFDLMVLIFLALGCFTLYVKSYDDSDDNQDEEPKAPTSQEEFRQMYIKMLINKRKLHHDAIKKMLELKDSKKEKEMVNTVLKKLFETLQKSLEKLAKFQSESGNKQGIQIDKQSISEISLIIENTAFAADLSLHFPKLFHKLYDNNKNYQTLLESSIGITIKIGLIDDETSKAINLMSQELNIIEKDPSFTNPYKNKNKKNLNTEPVAEQEQEPKDKKKKKEKKKRGPGLSGKKNEL